MNARIDVTDISIETSRLILRPWQTTDLDDLYAYASEPGVGEMAGWNHHKSKTESQMILNSFIKHKKTFALVWKESGKVIGSLGLEEMDPDPEGSDKLGREIGYVLSKDYWGNGFMPEAVSAVAKYCFDALSYDYLSCGHFLNNQQSRRVIEKCGFTYVTTVDYTTRMGTHEQTMMYVLYNPNRKR